jgi:phosphoglycolate phosphatase-like HAD superfamily hydrolase
VSVAETLVLWDVDLTLLDLRRMGGGWFREAMVEVTGRTPDQMPAFGGRTDRWIAVQMLTAVGLDPSDELIDELHAAMVRIAGEQRARIAELGVVLPGVPEVLATLAEMPAVAQSLVTGNLQPIAGLKVAAFDLARYLDLDIGGYGGASEQRAVLVAEALTGATRRHGTPFPTESVVVVGDTPHDVHAALAHGTRAIGVATGRHPADELLAAGAHAVLPNLAETDQVLTVILG